MSLHVYKCLGNNKPKMQHDATTHMKFNQPTMWILTNARFVAMQRRRKERGSNMIQPTKSINKWDKHGAFRGIPRPPHLAIEIPWARPIPRPKKSHAIGPSAIERQPARLLDVWCKLAVRRHGAHDVIRAARVDGGHKGTWLCDWVADGGSSMADAEMGGMGGN